MRILIVDDEAGKREKIREFVLSEVPDCDLFEARSFQSAIECIKKSTFDLIILDMRLSTYDASAAAAGGRPRNFGGEEIMRRMTRRRIVSPIVVLTQYTLFDDHGKFFSFEQISERLRMDHTNFHSMIHFSHSNSQWKTNLRTVLNVKTNKSL